MKISKVRLRQHFAVNLLYSVLRVYGFEFHLSTAEASNKKSQAVGFFGLAPQRLRVAMVRHALQNFLTKLALVGTLPTCGPHFAANLLYSVLRVYELQFYFSIPEGRQKNPKRGARWISPPACTGCEGQWSSMLFGYLRKTRALSALCPIAVTALLQFVVFRFPR